MKPISLITILTLSLSGLSQTNPIIAQTPTHPLINPQLSFKQPDYADDAPSGRDRGTGSRNNCPLATTENPININLIPLIPQDSRGLTLQSSPIIWIQVTYPSDTIYQEITANLSVENTQTFEKLSPKKTTISLPKQSGLFPIPLPHTLKVNQWYRWYLVLNCQSQNTTTDNSVISFEGMIKQVENPEIDIQIETLTPQAQINALAETGIWYDLVNQIIQLGCNNQSNEEIDQYWRTLWPDHSIPLKPIACQ